MWLTVPTFLQEAGAASWLPFWWVMDSCSYPKPPAWFVYLTACVIPSSVVFDFIILVLSRLLEKQTLSQLNSDIYPSHVFGFVQSCPSFEKGMKCNMAAILRGGGQGGGRRGWGRKRGGEGKGRWRGKDWREELTLLEVNMVPRIGI